MAAWKVGSWEVAAWKVASSETLSLTRAWGVLEDDPGVQAGVATIGGGMMMPRQLAAVLDGGGTSEGSIKSRLCADTRPVRGAAKILLT